MGALELEALDHLACIVQAEHIGAGTHTGTVDFVTEAEGTQHMHAIGAELEARADFGELRGLFIDFHIVTSPQQADGSGEAADAGSHDDDLLAFHGVSSP